MGLIIDGLMDNAQWKSPLRKMEKIWVYTIVYKSSTKNKIWRKAAGACVDSIAQSPKMQHGSIEVDGHDTCCFVAQFQFTLYALDISM
jgi:hypothetical protein